MVFLSNYNKRFLLLQLLWKNLFLFFSFVTTVFLYAHEEQTPTPPTTTTRTKNIMLRRSKKLSLGMEPSDILEDGIFNHDVIDNNSMDGCEDDVEEREKEESDKQEKKKYLFLKDDKPDTDEQVLKFSKKLFQDAAVVGKSVSCDPTTNLASVVVSSTNERIDYPCSFVDLQSFIPLEQLGADVRVNDIWGWTHNETGIEYAIIGLDSGMYV